MYYATAAMPVRGMPKGWTARVLFLRKPDGSVEPYARLVEYMTRYQFRSSTWQDTIARGLGLFWDFCQIRGEAVMREAEGTRTHPQTALFQAFARALVNGSDAVGIEDGLRWPRTGITRCRDFVAAIERFAEWNDGDEARSAIVPAKLRRSVSDAMSVTDMLVWSRVRNVSMLKHISAPHV
ncbi:MAG: hypothetical protein ACOH2L_16000, partial [Devosia sp.]